jgi:hypothetical protein
VGAQDAVAELVFAPRPVAFVALAVDLDDQPAVGPMEVDLDVLDVGVHARLRYPHGLTHGVELDFVAALCAGAATEVVGDRRQGFREVDAQAGDACHGDALVGRSVSGVDGRFVEPDARRQPAFSRDQDIDDGGAMATDGQDFRPGLAREQGLVPAGEHRREELAVAREACMSRRAHTAVLAKERATRDALSHRARAQSERSELVDPDQRMLAVGVPRDLRIDGGCRRWASSQDAFRRHPPNPERSGKTDLHAFATKQPILCVFTETIA